MISGKPYKIIDHPSDIGIEVYGKDKPELFENAAFGMMDMMFDLTNVQVDKSYMFHLNGSANDFESLLVSFLSNILYIIDKNKKLLLNINIKSLTDKEVVAEAFSGKIGEVKSYIKAVTYNQLEVKKEKDHWKARIIFDV